MKHLFSHKFLFLFLGIITLASSLSAQQPFTIDRTSDGVAAVKDEFTFVPPPKTFEDGIRTATFDITYTGFTPAAQTAFQYAADIWASILISNVPIKIEAFYLTLPGGTLGITFPNGRKNFTGAPIANTWYATSLANKLANAELNPGEADVNLLLTSSVNWYFGTDGNCPAGQYDFVSIVLHEICHGLGLVGLEKDSLAVGSFGLLYPSDFGGIGTTFPWPALDTLPGAYDNFLVDNGNNLLVGYVNPSSALATAFTSNLINFNGINALVMNNLTQPRIYAPAVFALGSSMVHLNEATYPAGSINELMTPFSGTADAVHDPGPIAIGILEDIGWTVNYSSGINEASAPNGISVYPNPVKDELRIADCELRIGSLEIFDVFGRSVMKMNSVPNIIDVSDFASGIYLMRIESKNGAEDFSFIKN